MATASWTRRAALVALVLALVPVAVIAQSGRKIPRRTPSEPAAAPAPAPSEPREPPAVTEDVPKLHVSLAKYVATFDIPSSVASDVVSACAQALTASGRCDVLTGKDLNRKEVTDAAKSSTETYYVWIQVSVDTADENRAITGSYRNVTLVAAYSLYAPGTTKPQTQGRLYFTPYRSTVGVGGVGIPGTRSSSAYAPDEAGQRIAQYVLESMAGRGGSSTPTVHF